MRQKLDSEVSVGFTEDELQLGAKLLRRLVNDGEQEAAGDNALNQLVSDLRFKMQERWLTIGHLQQIADEVTRYYRSKGYMLAQAYLPAQTVSGGEVVIQVMEGIIDDVLVQNNERYGETLIREPFTDIIGQPAYKNRVESGLLQLSDYPGLSVFGVFQPGEAVGTSELLLNVQEETHHQTDIQLDNSGSEYTGDYRLQVSYTNNNITRAADALNIRLMSSFHPSNSTYGAIQYQRPIFNRHNKLIVDLNRNTYTLGGSLSVLNAEGTSDTASLAWRHSFVRSRTSNHYGMIKLATKGAELTGFQPSQDDLTVMSVEYGLDAFDFRFSGVNLLWARYSQGLSTLGAMEAENALTSSRVGESGTRAGSEFSKIELRYDRLQTITENQSVLLTLYGQYSGDLLVSTEQMAIGGPGSVRAYPLSEYLMDKGYFFSVEWSTKAPFISDVPVLGTTWGQVLQLVAFADAGGGRMNDPATSSGDTAAVSISGVGVGARVKVKDFSMHLDIANPLSTEDASNDRNTQYFFRLNYVL